MTIARLVSLSLLSSLSLAAVPAFASVCVEVDTSRDTLSEQERVQARGLLAHVLASQGQEVSKTGCSGSYVVYHLKFGNSITVFMQGPNGSRQATARSLEDVPPLYDQMVRSLLLNRPMSETGDSINRHNVTASEAAPNRAAADSLWYVRLGYGAVVGPSTSGGPAFGFGYRYELDNIGIDVSFLNLVLATNDSKNNSSASANGSWIKAMALWFADPNANRSFYAGAGLSWGATAAASGSSDSITTYEGSGLQGELSVGYELLRASTIRLFLQADAGLPFYMSRATVFDSNLSTSSDKSKWTPVFAFSFGVGWGRGIQTVHVVQ